MVWAVPAIGARTTGKQEERSKIRPVAIRVMMACATFVMYGGGDPARGFAKKLPGPVRRQQGQIESTKLLSLL